MHITSDDNFIYVVGAHAAVRNYLISDMGASYSKAKDHCKMFRNTGVMNELFQKVPDLRSVPGFMELGYKLKAEKESKLSIRRLAAVPVIHESLRSYQNEDVHYLSQLDAAGIFNEPRTGKTPTTLFTIQQKQAKLNLIIVPASLLWTWAKEIEKWMPGQHIEVIEKSAKFDSQMAAFLTVKPKKSFLIMSKNMLPNVVDKILRVNFDTMVVDEAHFLRNYRTKQSTAVYKIKAKSRYALTGTPTVSHPVNVFGILKFLYPKQYTSYWTFVDRYFNKEDNYFGGGDKVGDLKPHRQKELQEEVGMVSVSRKRAEVMDWLPEKEYEFIACKMSTAQAKAYSDMRNTFVHLADDGVEVDAQNTITQLMKLRRLAMDPRIEGLKTRGAKTDQLIQWLEDNDKPQVVVMSMFTSYLKLLNEELSKKGYRIGMITGEEKASEKVAAAALFQDGDIDVLLCNTISAGTGWTLDAADTVIFMDNAWTPADQQQAEDRVTPTTPDRVHRHRVVAFQTIGTVDEWMFEVLVQKKSLTDLINEGGREAVRNLLP